MQTDFLSKTKAILLIIPCLAVFSSSVSYAAQTGAEADKPEITNEEPGKQQRWAAFPVIASSPETGLILGGMLFHFFPVQDPDQQASTIDMMAYATTEDQYSISISPNVFFENNKYRFCSTVAYTSWEANYYGIGNDSSDDYEEYESKSIGASLVLEMKLFDSLIMGLVGSFASEDMTTKAGGMLQTGNVPGAGDADYGGLGIRFGYDTRDNTNAPHAGALVAYESVWFDEDFGSDYDFDIQSLDIRHFTLIKEDKVLALSAQFQDSHGQVPFRYLPTPDGTKLLRKQPRWRRASPILKYQNLKPASARESVTP